MRTVKTIAAVGAALVMSAAAHAADMPSIVPPPAYYAPQPAPIEDFGGWYLRGDIGVGSNRVKNLDIRNYQDAGISINQQTLGFDSAGIYSVGLGYQFNGWLRADITGQYRGNANFKGQDLVWFNGVPLGADTYGASVKSFVAMANLYADLGTWWCLTPFIGVGVGYANTTISNFTDQGVSINGNFGAVPSSAYAASASKWNVAYALHAGVAYKVNPALTVELGYSYLNLGDGLTGSLTNFQGFTRGNAFTFKDITSHDVKLGVRWSLDDAACCGPVAPPAPPLLMRKG
jgi:opacity protein-like surface antigen